jgi:hypothetical protein
MQDNNLNKSPGHKFRVKRKAKLKKESMVRANQIQTLPGKNI